MTTEKIYFNGILGTSGDYFTKPLKPAALAKLARTFPPRPSGNARGPRAGLDPADLSQVGWGVIFAQGLDPAIRDALAPLLELRKAQATTHSELLYGEANHLIGESRRLFLPRHGASPGLVNPPKMPYYLLIVGDPRQTLFSFQHDLDTQYAVGRLFFDTVEEYAHYAQNVVAHEKAYQEGRTPNSDSKICVRLRKRPCRHLTLFGPQHDGDPATQVSHEQLLIPLAKELGHSHPQWRIDTFFSHEAHKANLKRVMGGDRTPEILFTAGHAVGFPPGHPRQLQEQGALLCADWPGPAHRGAIPGEYLFGAGDVSQDAQLRGLISFHFGCFSGGTPDIDSFPLPGRKSAANLAPQPFVAPLPRRLLGHPKSGALAVIGHVDRAWEHSFLWPGSGGPQIAVFADCLAQLMAGKPVGLAMESFGQRYADLATWLYNAFLDPKAEALEDDELIHLWTAFQDARSYMIFGDPAVRAMG